MSHNVTVFYGVFPKGQLNKEELTTKNMKVMTFR